MNDCLSSSLIHIIFDLSDSSSASYLSKSHLYRYSNPIIVGPNVCLLSFSYGIRFFFVVWLSHRWLSRVDFFSYGVGLFDCIGPCAWWILVIRILFCRLSRVIFHFISILRSILRRFIVYLVHLWWNCCWNENNFGQNIWIT